MLDHSYNHRYTTWTPKEGSRTALLISNNGLTYDKVAVFSNAENVKVFEKWMAELVAEVIKNYQAELVAEVIKNYLTEEQA